MSACLSYVLFFFAIEKQREEFFSKWKFCFDEWSNLKHLVEKWNFLSIVVAWKKIKYLTLEKKIINIWKKKNGWGSQSQSTFWSTPSLYIIYNGNFRTLLILLIITFPLLYPIIYQFSYFYYKYTSWTIWF